MTYDPLGYIFLPNQDRDNGPPILKPFYVSSFIVSPQCSTMLRPSEGAKIHRTYNRELSFHLSFCSQVLTLSGRSLWGCPKVFYLLAKLDTSAPRRRRMEKNIAWVPYRYRLLILRHSLPAITSMSRHTSPSARSEMAPLSGS